MLISFLLFLLNKLAMHVFTNCVVKKCRTGHYTTSTTLSQGNAAQTKTYSEHPKGAFSTALLFMGRSGNSDTFLTAGLSVLLLLTSY